MTEHTLTQLRGLRLDGMVHALQDTALGAAGASLAFVSDRLIGATS